MRTLAAARYKATCLAVLDDVARTGECVLIVKRGRPVAQLVPPILGERGHPQQRLRGTAEILGDIVAPVLPADAWEACGGRRAPRRGKRP
jgi:antitoxin (DNA-binding transcriptional repressor) of toxin-antitoxin stability system